MIEDERMMIAFANTLWVAAAVALISVVIGTAAAILINSSPAGCGLRFTA
jgi:spermidine/putrescine transport system permease protein